MMNNRIVLVIFVTLCLLLGLLTSCKEDTISLDPSIRVAFSIDTLTFDTVFTAQGSAAKQVMLYNTGANAVRLDRVWLKNGAGSFFYINIDGENDMNRMSGMVIRGGDSMFLFVRVQIDPLMKNNPVLIEDALYASFNGNTATLALEAIGQDVVRVKGVKGMKDTTDVHFTAARPYLIYDTLLIRGQLDIDAGTRLYMHDKALIVAAGDVNAKGTLSQPVRIMGDRLDNLFDSVPYSYSAGQWKGIYLYPANAFSFTKYDLEYVDIIGANYGLFCDALHCKILPEFTLKNSRVHNHAQYGVILLNANSLVANTEISNAAAFCLYMASGKHRVIHSTIASYFNNTNVRIQSSQRFDVPAVYIDNHALDADSVALPETQVDFTNCVITGIGAQNLLVDTPYTQSYFSHNYIKADSVLPSADIDNIYYQPTDSAEVFRQTFYRYKEYRYYDFSLDSLSPARGIGDSAMLTTCPADRRGVVRSVTSAPDAGCYQYQPY